ncbi:MAG: sulfatase-like hydrolase/transferase [Hyphomicrobiaceae bacterium]|nr:MAG: sulfatase-like hydrolase/transferase [Hyphomicrobiaceae bacterium]
MAQGRTAPGTARGALGMPRAARSALARVAWCAAAWPVTFAVAAAAGIYFFAAEGGPANSLFGTAVTFAIAALIAAASRRLMFASVLTGALVAFIHTVSWIKQETTELILHAYDVVAFLGLLPEIERLRIEHSGHAAALFAGLAAMALLGAITYLVDSTRISRLRAASIAVVFAAAAAAAADAKGERRHTEYYFESRYVTFFYASWAETIEALRRGNLIQTSGEAQPPHLGPPADCASAGRRPHIILVHQESVVPPAFFPSLSYDRRLDPFFHSFDGQLHKLSVETYGGASWLTEFSVLTGLSARSFGGMRQFVQPMTAGKLKDTLPKALATCGYRNVMLYPMLRHFLASGRFFETAGFGEIIDAKAQGAQHANERDRFYYANALSEMERHFKTSTKPLFLYVQTMATHGSYGYTYMPEVNVPGGGPGTHPYMHEYLRRLAMAAMDYAYLRTELVRRFPGRPFLIVHYGDHHPLATQTLLGYGEDASIEDIVQSGNAAALTTYYAIDAIRYRPPPLSGLDPLDVAYLSTTILEAAGLPLPETHRERKRLMMLCGGRYHDCPAQDEILKFHRRLIDSGLMKPL